MYIYMHIHMHICIYIYIDRELLALCKFAISRKLWATSSLVEMGTIYMHTYAYIYIYRERERQGALVSLQVRNLAEAFGPALAWSKCVRDKNATHLFLEPTYSISVYSVGTSASVTNCWRSASFQICQTALGKL